MQTKNFELKSQGYKRPVSEMVFKIPNINHIWNKTTIFEDRKQIKTAVLIITQE